MKQSLSDDILDKDAEISFNDTIFLNSYNVLSEENQNVYKKNKITTKIISQTFEVETTQSTERTTQEICSLSAWGLPKSILDKYGERGLINMFSWQAQCLRNPKILLEDKNIVYSAPTSAGKTLVAEILAIKVVLERKKKVIIILPFVSVVREKMFYFQDILSDSGVRVEGFMGSHNPPGGFKMVNLAICTIEKANGIINRLLEEGCIGDIGAVVVDEMHLLGDPHRGYLLELLLTKLKYMTLKIPEVKIQLIGMSATLPNLNLLAGWLDAELYTTNFRPIPLEEFCLVNGELYNNNLKLIRHLKKIPELHEDTDNILQICLETISTSCSVLIFCPTKNWCENLAQQISVAFWKIGRIKSEYGQCLRDQLNCETISETLEQLQRSPVGLDDVLKKTVSFGVAFHHAGLTMDERDILEGAFRTGAIRVLVATSTLSSGVNLPARRVIIRTPMFHGKPIDTLTYRQMIGRAGRMGKDSAGESILICQKNDRNIALELMSANLQPIESCLEGTGKLKRAILEVIASGVATTPEEVQLFTKCTLLANGRSENDESSPISTAVEFLKENEFIRLQNNDEGGLYYVPTALAKACLSSSLPPEDGLALFEELEKGRRCLALDTELHLLYLVTPYSVCNQWSNLDWMSFLNMWEKLPASDKRVADLVGVKESFIFNATKGKINTKTAKMYHRLQTHRRFYTALALQNLVQEIPLNDVADKFQCSRGMLQSLQQSASTFAGMVTAFSRQLGWTCIEILIEQFQDRLQFGIHHELLDLMKVPLLNGPRARTLYNADIKSLVDLANCDVCKLENILHSSMPFQSEKERDGETENDVKKRKDLRCFWITGKRGLTAREASEMLIRDSREYLQHEMGAEVKWENGDENTGTTSSDSNSSYDLEVSKENIPPEQQEKSQRLSKSKNISMKSTVNKRSNIAEKLLEALHADKSDISEPDVNKNNSLMSTEKLNIVPEANIGKQILKSNIFKVNTDKDVSLKRHSVIEDIEKSSNCFKIERVELEKKSVQQLNNSIRDIDLDSFSFINENLQLKEKWIIPLNNTNDIKESIEEMNISSFSFNDDNLQLDVGLLNNTNDIKDSTKDTKIFDSFSFNDNFTNASVDNDTSNNSVKSLKDGIKHSCAIVEKNSMVSNSNKSANTKDEPSYNWTMFDNEFSVNSPNKPNKTSNVDSNMMLDLSSVSRNSFNTNLNATNDSDSLFEDSICLDSKICNVLDIYIHAVAQCNDNEKINIVLNDSNEVVDKVNECENSIANDELNFVNENQIICADSSSDECDKIKMEMEYLFDDNFDNILCSSLNKNCNYSNNISDDEKELFNDENDSDIVDTSQSEMNYSLSTYSVYSSSKKKHKTVANQKKRKKCQSAENTTPKKKKIVENSYNLHIVDTIEYVSFMKTLKQKKEIAIAVGCECYVKKPAAIGGNIVKSLNQLCNNVCDTESFVVGSKQICGIAITWGKETYYISFNKKDYICNKEKIQILKSIFESENITIKIMCAKEHYNLLYKAFGIRLNGHLEDPQVAHWLLHPESNKKNVGSLVATYAPDMNLLLEKDFDIAMYPSMGLCTERTISSRNRTCLEAFIAWHVSQMQSTLLRQELTDVYRTEMKTVQYLAQMELNGLGVDELKLKQLINTFKGLMQLLEERAYRLARRKFKISSSKEVARVLGTYKGKKVCTNKQTLENMDNPLSDLIVQWRKLSCILVKTLIPIQNSLNEIQNRIHGCCVSCSATGRITMHEPNLQSIPRNFDITILNETPVPINVREAFVPIKGNILLAADYCQLELRLLAHFSQDPTLMSTIKYKDDIFKAIAASLYNVSEYTVDDAMRQKAKSVCYGIIYGMGAKTLAAQLHTTEETAKLIKDTFYNTYPNVKTYVKDVITACEKSGYVQTKSGRKRYLIHIKNDNNALKCKKDQAQRQAINTTIQGSAADLVKTAMVNLNKELIKCIPHETDHMQSRVMLVLHMHDELLYEVQKDDLKLAAKIIKHTMETAGNISVPLPVKVKTGNSWGELQEYPI